MSAVVKIDGESRGAQEAIAKVEVGLRGVASTAVASSSTTSSALGGMAASFGKMSAAVFLGGSAVEVARKGLQFLTSSVSEYIAENEDARRQTEGVTIAYRNMRMQIGATIVSLGEITGVTDVFASAMQLAGDAMQSAFGPDVNERIANIANSLNDVAAGMTAVQNLGIAAIEAEIRSLDTSIGERAAAVGAMRNELAEAYRQYEGTAFFESQMRNNADLAEAQAGLNAELERRNELAAEALRLRAAGESGARTSGGVGAPFAGGAVDVAPAPGESGGGGGGRSEPRNAFGLTEREQAEVDNATRDAQAAFADFLQTDAAERRSRLDLVAELAAEEVEIERGKQAALVELRASVKAGGLQADAEQAAAALDVIRGRQEDIARTTSEAFGGLADANEKFSKSVVKSLANQLAVRGIEAIYEGGMMVLRGNPLGAGLAALGVGALGAARGIGASISEGGGRGAGAAAAPVTNNNVSVRVVAPAGMTTDTAAYVAAAAEEGARRGLAQDRR